jgi:hypothetical protein
LLLHLVERENVTNAQSGIGNVEFVVGPDFPGRGAIMLAQYMIANGVDEGSKALRMIDVSVSEHAEDASERFLAHVFDIFATVEAFARFEANQFAEVGKEVFLSLEVPGTKPVYIGRIEILELHWHGCFLPRKRPSELAFFPRLPVNALSGEKSGHSF